MALKRDKLDKVISDIVRQRENWTCERCGKYFPEGHRQGLHASHLYSRRHASTRHHTRSIFAHCFACHQYLGGNPVEFTAWARDALGDAAFEELRERHHKTVKRTKAEKEEMYQWYKAQLEYLKKCQEEKKFCVIAEWD